MTPLESVIFLMMSSKVHRDWYIKDIEAWVLPALQLNQYRLLHDNGKPVGYVSWAYLRKEIARAFVEDNAIIPLEEWNCGEMIWSIDFIAPFGHVRQLVKKMHHLHGPGLSKRAKDGSIRQGGKIIRKGELWSPTLKK